MKTTFVMLTPPPPPPDLTNVSLGQTVVPVLSLEQKIILTAALSDAERFSDIPYSMEGSLNAIDDQHHAVSGGKVLCSIQL
jgi:DNA-directed RNA polymerase III subunit RPC3